MNRPGVMDVVTTTLTLDVSRFTEGMARVGEAAERAAISMEVTGYMLEAGHRGVSPAARKAGLEARFYIRGALDPRFSDRRRASRYATALGRRHMGAFSAFMRGLSERDPDAVERGTHSFRRWGSEGVAVVLR